ncbi:unnamed protein product [Brachionus calyciflorus]|uniref:Kinase n=1 Tax=Brachionus calyciflorus TaxID=104777 RepID=A0A813RS82_9BILA|nr:unnamed protein product [Brachionus calyciflorus]
MKTLITYHVHQKLDTQETSNLMLNDSTRLNTLFYPRNRSMSKNEIGLISNNRSKSLTKSESFNLEEKTSLQHSVPKIHSTHPVSQWDVLCKVINCKVAFKKQFNGKKYNWIQLAGHAGRFKPGEREGFILKLMDNLERNSLQILQNDILSDFVPKIDKILLDREDENYYTEMQDLLYSFTNPCIMDIKIGVRTFIIDNSNEKETKPRNDLYLKLIEVSPDEPTEEEHQLKAITKRRYMSWREKSTCSATLGFRIEAIKKNQVKEKEFYSVKDKSEVMEHFKHYTDDKKYILKMYLERLVNLKENLKKSDFFKSHEMIGSSLLFVHDEKKANIWMIDFGKTRRLPEGTHIRHDVQWEEGNYEDGYLIGLQSLIDIFQETIEH